METPEQAEKRKEKCRAYYANNRDKLKKQILHCKFERKHQNQQYVFDLLKEKGCVDCGEQEPRKLEFDHVRGKKTKNVSSLVNEGASLKRIKKEIEKCEIRCANCHRYKLQ